MAVTAKQTETDFKPCPEGNHTARCIGVVDLGTHPMEFAGQKKMIHKIRLMWELPDEKRDDGKPFQISKDYGLSLHEKSTLRKDLEGWRGKRFTEKELSGFDVEILAGKTCMINVLHKKSTNGKTYANITSVSATPKGMKCPEQINDTILFSFENFSQESFSKLPKFIREKIMQTPEYQEATSPQTDITGGLVDDDDDSFTDQETKKIQANESDGLPF